METKDVLMDLEKEMVSKEIANIGPIKLESRSITLLAGPANAGKTATSLHFADSAIKNGLKVLYIDTEEKVVSRASPNLFKELYAENEAGYKERFNMTTIFSTEDYFKLMKDLNPDLVIIDSIYRPFNTEFKDPRGRAKAIRDFLNDCRTDMHKNSRGIVITSQIGRVVYSANSSSYVALGGEGLKHLSDIKIMLQFDKKETDGGFEGGNRLAIVDKQIVYNLSLGAGGRITVMSYEDINKKTELY